MRDKQEKLRREWSLLTPPGQRCEKEQINCVPSTGTIFNPDLTGPTTQHSVDLFGKLTLE